MAGGPESSAILKAIRQVSRLTSAEFSVHLSKRWRERDPLASARNLFYEYGLNRTPERNGILIYLNLRKKTFAIFTDEALLAKIPRKFWDEFAYVFRDDLLSTQYENAIQLAVKTLAITASKYFPPRV